MTRPFNNQRDKGQVTLRALAMQLDVSLERAPMAGSWVLWDADGEPIAASIDRVLNRLA
jgi:hypothetical protein